MDAVLVSDQKASGSQGHQTQPGEMAERTIALLEYHGAHPEVSNRRLGKLFGISKQRVGHILKRNKRDRRVIGYLQAHPEARLAELTGKFHITKERAHALYLASRDQPCSATWP